MKIIKLLQLYMYKLVPIHGILGTFLFNKTIQTGTALSGVLLYVAFYFKNYNLMINNIIRIYFVDILFDQPNMQFQLKFRMK